RGIGPAVPGGTAVVSDGTPAEPWRPPGSAGARCESSGAGAADRDEEELTHLLQFFYQCPVGLFEIDDAGVVRMVNPAAVRLLAPVISDGDLSSVFPLLRRLAPEMVEVISARPGRMGPLAA